MALFEKKRNSEHLGVSEMTAAERRDRIAELEGRRMDIVREMEAIMTKLAKDTKRSRLARRKFPLGKSPNDYTK